MTRNEKRFGVIGTIGNGSELRPIPRVEPVKSYHVFCDFNDTSPDDNEVAIRYEVASAQKIADLLSVEGVSGACVITKPIFRELPPEWSN